MNNKFKKLLGLIVAVLIVVGVISVVGINFDTIIYSPLTEGSQNKNRLPANVTVKPMDLVDESNNKADSGSQSSVKTGEASAVSVNSDETTKISGEISAVKYAQQKFGVKLQYDKQASKGLSNADVTVYRFRQKVQKYFVFNGEVTIYVHPQTNEVIYERSLAVENLVDVELKAQPSYEVIANFAAASQINRGMVALISKDPVVYVDRSTQKGCLAYHVQVEDPKDISKNEAILIHAVTGELLNRYPTVLH